jgi:hypothetical protein
VELERILEKEVAHKTWRLQMHQDHKKDEFLEKMLR